MPSRSRPGNVEIARRLGAAGHRHGSEFLDQHIHPDIDADFDLGAKDHTLGFHLFDPAVDQSFVHLEVGDAVAQQPADAVALFEHRHRVPGAGELLGASEARRPRADNGNRLAGPLCRRYGLDPALGPAAVDDRAFDRLDRDRVVLDVESARRFARRRADAPGEFREVVGRMQGLQRCQPLIAIDEVVPVRDQVVDRAAVVAERDAAIHAARRLLARLRRGQRLDELRPAAAADIGLLIGPVAPLDLEKPRRSAHRSVPRYAARQGRAMLLTYIDVASIRWAHQQPSCRRRLRNQPQVYPMTASACANRIGGRVRPSALAVFRLMTSSNLVGRSNGRSAGFAPFRMRSI